MRVLLDTPTVIWAKIAPATLSRQATVIIADLYNEILVSAASAWEIATKVRVGKFPEAWPFEKEFLVSMEESGYTLIPIDAATALRAGRFAAAHKDPFDRIIAAQAIAEDLPILSADLKLDTFGVTRMIW